MVQRIEHIFEDGVEKRHCGLCKTFKSLESFGNCKTTWDKLRPTCKDCLKSTNAANKEKRTEYNKKYWQTTKEEQQKKNKEWREKNKERAKENNKKWVEANKEHKKAKDKEYRAQNIERHRKTHRDYVKRKYHELKNDVTRLDDLANYKIKKNTSRRIREIMGQEKSECCMDYVGCSLDKFRIHLESTMSEGMSWNNYGQTVNGDKKFVWHMDHIIPCDAFDMSNEVERLACFHYKNLRACWWNENIEKSNSYNPEDKRLYMQRFIEVYIA